MRLTSRIFSGISGKSLVVGGTTFLAVVAFTVTGVTSSMQGLDANVAAQVGNQVITLKTLQGVVQRQTRRDNTDENARTEAIKSALDSLIQERVIVEEASRIGWTANDIEVAYWIKSIPSFQDEKTKVFDKKRYDEFIRSGQMSELELFQEGRNSISAQKYSALVSLNTHIPQALAKEYAKKANTQFTIEYVEIAAKPAALEKAVGEKATALLSDEAQLENLKKTYETLKDDYNRPESPRVSSLLIAHKDASQAQGQALQRSKEDALKKAQELLSQIKDAASGKDIVSLSDTDNDDFKAKSAKGDLGFVDENSLDPLSLTAARSLKNDGDVSDVIDTEFGFRIIKRTGFRAAVHKSFDDVKQELAEKQVRSEVTGTLNQELVVSFENALNAAPTERTTELEKLLQEKELSWMPVQEPINKDTRFVTEIGLAEPIVKNIFSLKTKNEILNKVLQVSGKNILIRLVERTENEPDDAKITSTADIETAKLRQKFTTEARRKLYDVFSENREIKRNASLFAAQ